MAKLLNFNAAAVNRKLDAEIRITEIEWEISRIDHMNDYVYEQIDDPELAALMAERRQLIDLILQMTQPRLRHDG